MRLLDFLSENANFAEIITKYGIKFIGPSSELIKQMGDKIEAKRTAKKLGLPVIEGSEGNIKSLDEAKKISSNMDKSITLGDMMGKKAKDLFIKKTMYIFPTKISANKGN